MVERRRPKHDLSFSDRLAMWAKEVREQADALSPGPERDALLKKARQAETAYNFSNSTGMQPPE